MKSGDEFTKGPISTGYTGLAGSNVYFAFDHMLVLTNTIVERLTGCRAATCAKGAKGYDFNGCQRIQAGKDCDGAFAKTSGFLGMLYKQTRGIAYNPSMNQALGLCDLSVVNYWKTTLGVMYLTAVNFAWATFGARLAINVPLGIAGAAMYGFNSRSSNCWGNSYLNDMLDIFVTRRAWCMCRLVPLWRVFCDGCCSWDLPAVRTVLLYIFGFWLDDRCC